MIEFKKEEDRILAEALNDAGVNIKKGDKVILRGIFNQFQHPNNCYVDSIKTGRWLGRYKIKDFEVIRHLEDNEDIQNLLLDEPTTQSVSGEHQQMTLF